MKQYQIVFAALCPLMGFGDTAIILNSTPTVLRNAELREAIRQDSTWTSENIAKNPYLFLQDQIANCDKLRAKIEAQNITLIRMGKHADRKVEEAVGMQARYGKFLSDAKAAYKAANGKWPVSVNGYELNEEEFNDRVADAIDRVELVKKELTDNKVISKKVSIRKDALKSKKRELALLRAKLVQQAAQVKMNSALAELGVMQETVGLIKDMMVEIDDDPTKLSIDDITTEDTNTIRTKKVNAFLND